MVMTDQQKYLLLGAVGVGGFAYWYFFYGPGVTAAATTTVATSTPASVVPSAANGATVPVPAIVQSFVGSMGPKSQAQWQLVIPQLPASNVSAMYQNLAAIVPYWSNGTTPPTALTNAVNSWFTANGFGSLSS
jgi:hypothetical protein